MSKAGLDVGPKLDKFLDYFTIMPVSLDPKGVVSKIEHMMNLSDDRLKREIEIFSGNKDPVKVSIANNVIQAANALNLIYKIVRHFFLLGRKTKNVYLMIQLQMIMPMIMEISEAFSKAVDALQQMQPIGDGIGPMIIGKMMLGKKKTIVAKETLMVQTEMMGRKIYLLRASAIDCFMIIAYNGILNFEATSSILYLSTPIPPIAAPIPSATSPVPSPSSFSAASIMTTAVAFFFPLEASTRL